MILETILEDVWIFDNIQFDENTDQRLLQIVGFQAEHGFLAANGQSGTADVQHDRLAAFR